MKIVRIAKIKFLGAIKKLLYHWKLFLTSLLNIWTVLFRFKIRPNEIFLTHPSCPLIFLRSSFSQYLVGFKLCSQKCENWRISKKFYLLLIQHRKWVLYVKANLQTERLRLKFKWTSNCTCGFLTNCSFRLNFKRNPWPRYLISYALILYWFRSSHL